MGRLLGTEENFRELLARVRPEIDCRLTILFRDELARVRATARGALPMARAAESLCLRGGKRFRAALALVGYLGTNPKAKLDPCLQLGAAIELFHAYLLIQDDWMDQDDRRRGGPTVHTLLSTGLGGHSAGCSSILASDLTFGLACSTILGLTSPPATVIRTMSVLMDIHRTVVLGQELDVTAGTQKVAQIHQLKTTSYTVMGPLRLGATLAGRAELPSLERYAKPLGLAFQMRDDYLGVFGTEEDAGKRLFGDFRQGKRTSVITFSEKYADARAHRALGDARRPNADEAAFLKARSELIRCGVHQRLLAAIHRQCKLAETAAKSLVLTSWAQTQLATAAQTVAQSMGTG